MWPDFSGSALGRGQLAGLLRASLPRGRIPARRSGGSSLPWLPLAALTLDNLSTGST